MMVSLDVWSSALAGAAAQFGDTDRFSIGTFESRMGAFPATGVVAGQLVPLLHDLAYTPAA